MQTIDLRGPEGNAYALLGIAKRAFNDLKWENWDEVRKDMTSSDYDHLVEVFNDHLSEFYELIN